MFQTQKLRVEIGRELLGTFRYLGLEVVQNENIIKLLQESLSFLQKKLP